MGIEIILIIVGGLIAGGIVNILADDLPFRRPVRLPRYVSNEKKRSIHIPWDGKIEDHPALQDDEKRPAIAWLGLTAFMFGKRTSPSGIKLSWRYPLAEILSVFMMLLAFSAINNVNTDPNSELHITTLQTVFWLTYMAIFTLITVIDIEHKLILFVVMIPSGIVALLDALITSAEPSLKDAIIGGVIGFIIFFILYNGGFLFTYIMGKLKGQKINEVAFGYGDVMMATLSGLILGWRYLFFAFYITVFLGAGGAVIYLLSRKVLGQKYTAFTALPYGPYIVAGTTILLLYREPVVNFFWPY